MSLGYVLNLDQWDIKVDFALCWSISCGPGQCSKDNCPFYAPLLYRLGTCWLLQWSKISRTYTFEIFPTFKWVKPQLFPKIRKFGEVVWMFSVCCLLNWSPLELHVEFSQIHLDLVQMQIFFLLFSFRKVTYVCMLVTASRKTSWSSQKCAKEF